MPTRLRTLGTLRAYHDGGELERLPAQPVRCALLLYLALERELTRDAVLGMLWPDQPPDRARHTLSQTIYELRQILGDDWVELRGDRFFVSPSVQVDALEFRDAVEKGEAERALELYGGAFLGGTCPPTTRAFEGWVDMWQAKLVRLHRRARREAIDGRIEAGDSAAALRLARGWVELDPLDDEAQHRLIKLLAETGDRSGALRQYEQYKTLVREQLELEPLDETKELVAEIQRGTADTVPRGGGAVAAGMAPDEAPVAGPDAPDTPGPESPPRPLRQELRERRLIHWAVGYLASSIAVLEGADILFGWPEWLQPRLWLLVGIGLIMVLVAAWNHGELGIQRITGPELVAQSMLAGALVLILFWRPAGSSGPTPPLTEIAVLHLDDFSADTQENLADQLTEALIAELDWSQGIEVRPRAAVAPFRDRETPLDSVARALRVGAIVEGSVHTIDEEIRLTLQLFDAWTHQHLLTDTLHASRGSRAETLATLPRDAARRILRRIGEEVRLREVRRRTDSQEAWELYARAGSMLDEDWDVWSEMLGSEQALSQVDSLLAEAEAADRDWPDATVRRADVWRRRALLLAEPDENYQPAATGRAIAHLDRALQQHPGFAPALMARGALRVELAENVPVDSANVLRRAAERDLRAAVAADPNDALAWRMLADLLQRWGRHMAAFRAAERALEADAFLEYEPSLLFWYAIEAHSAGLHDEAAAGCDSLRTRYPGAHITFYCQIFVLSADPTRAPDPRLMEALKDSLVRSASPRRQDAFRNLGTLYLAKTLARAGMADSARTLLQPFLDDREQDGYTLYDHAHARLLLGEVDLALDLLEDYVRRNPAKALTLRTDWYFRPLWDDERFQDLTEAGGERRPAAVRTMEAAPPDSAGSAAVVSRIRIDDHLRVIDQDSHSVQKNRDRVGVALGTRGAQSHDRGPGEP